MKNSVEVEKYRVSRGLNLLAKQIVELEFTPEMITTQINKQFDYIPKKERPGLVREAINRSYQYAWSVPETRRSIQVKAGIDTVMPFDKIKKFGNTIKECVAVKIARHIISALCTHTSVVNSDGSFSNTFYVHCLARMKKKNVVPQIDDRELLEIYLKQMGHVVRKTSLAGHNAGLRKFNGDITAEYTELFLSFWERVSWEDIFPSNPAASRELSQCKTILIDLIAAQKGKFSIRSLANEFFSLTGFSEPGNIFMISFLDFYFFTWLSHFGILTYCRPVPEVCMKLTPFGKEFLMHLRERG